MKPLNVYEFVEFGTLVQTLRWYGAMRQSGTELKSYAEIKARQLGWFRDGWLAERKVGVELINLVILELENAVKWDDLREMRAKFANPPDWEPTDWERVFSTAIRHLNELMVVLEHEFPRLPVFSVSPQRAFDTTILLNEAERALSETSQKYLNEQWLTGWREAGRCLACSIPTASAYQMLRITEGFIKKYRRIVTGTDGADSDGLSEHINAVKKACVSESVIAALRSLKNAHRNPKMHPGKNATQDEAVSLFGLCTSVIDFIADDMLAREQAKAVKQADAS